MLTETEIEGVKEAWRFVGRMLWDAEGLALEDEIAILADSSFAGGAFSAAGTYFLPVMVFNLMLRGVKESDEQVENLVKDENTLTGLSQGSIMGMLGWKWSQVDGLFVRHDVLPIYQRPELNDLRVLYYNVGLRGGYHYAATLSPPARKARLEACRKYSGATPGAWNRRDQINYVIDLGVSFRRIYMPFS